jgi:hypothetical protein
MTLHPRELQCLTRETYAAHYILLNLGFSADDIFVATPCILNARPPGMHAAVILRPGPDQFVIPVAPVREQDREQYLEAWREFATAQPKMPRQALDRVVHASHLFAKRAEVVTALARRGIAMPAVTN